MILEQESGASKQKLWWVQSKGFDPESQKKSKKEKKAECVNKVSQEDYSFEGIYYSCLFVTVMS